MRRRSLLRRRKAHLRGISMIEILVVVAIMALIAAAVGIGAFRAWRGAQVKTATTGARTIRGAVKSYWVMTDSAACPTVDELIKERVLDEDSPRADPWGQRWRVECADDQVSVSSDGPDRVHGTEDDILVPPLSRNGPSPKDTGS